MWCGQSKNVRSTEIERIKIDFLEKTDHPAHIPTSTLPTPTATHRLTKILISMANTKDQMVVIQILPFANHFHSINSYTNLPTSSILSCTEVSCYHY